MLIQDALHFSFHVLDFFQDGEDRVFGELIALLQLPIFEHEHCDACSVTVEGFLFLLEVDDGDGVDVFLFLQVFLLYEAGHVEQLKSFLKGGVPFHVFG
jgi:hypothetical protein